MAENAFSFTVTAENDATNTYDTKHLELLVSAQESKIKDIKDVLDRQFENLATACDTNWIGPDEVEFKKLILSDIKNLYNNCIHTKNESCKFMTNKVREFQQFQIDQADNMLSSSVSIPRHSSGGISPSLSSTGLTVTVPEYTASVDPDLESTVKDFSIDDFDASTTFGLVKSDSAYQISQSVTTFQTEVVSVIEQYKTLQDENNQIFKSATTRDSSEDLGISNLLNQIGEVMSKLVGDLKTAIDEILPSLVSSYNARSEAISESVATSVENLKADDSGESTGTPEASEVTK